MNGTQITVSNALLEPGHVHGDDEVIVAPDGRCAASVVLAAFNVGLCSNTPRTPDGFVTSLDDIRREEKEVKKWLGGVAAVPQRHSKLKYVPRLVKLPNGACAETTDFPVLATATHHRNVVDPKHGQLYHHEHEQRNTSGTRPETNSCREDRIKARKDSSSSDAFRSLLTKREGASAAEEKIRKSRTSTGSIQQKKLRRCLGVTGPSVAVCDCFLKTICVRCFFAARNRNNYAREECSISTVRLYARVWTTVGAVLLKPGDVQTWRGKVSHRTGCVAKAWAEKGDIGSEADAANRTTVKHSVTFLSYGMEVEARHRARKPNGCDANVARVAFCVVARTISGAPEDSMIEKESCDF